MLSLSLRVLFCPPCTTAKLRVSTPVAGPALACPGTAFLCPSDASLSLKKRNQSTATAHVLQGHCSVCCPCHRVCFFALYPSARYRHHMPQIHSRMLNQCRATALFAVPVTECAQPLLCISVSEPATASLHLCSPFIALWSSQEPAALLSVCIARLCCCLLLLRIGGQPRYGSGNDRENALWLILRPKQIMTSMMLSVRERCSCRPY